MPDFRVHDTAPEHPKLRAAGLPAAGLWSMAGGWCMQPTNLTDGWVPAYWVATWPGGAKAARRLVQVGLWIETERNGVPGYQYHDWEQYQRTRAKVEEEQRKARERMAAVRKRSSGVRPNAQGTFSATVDERSPNVHDSLTHTLTQGSSWEGGVTTSRAREEPPPPRCPQHVDHEGDPGPCRACGDARQARETWDADADRRAAEQRSAEARQRAELRAQAIAACDLCDQAGYVGRQLCDHDPAAADRAARGAAAARAALTERRPAS